MQNKKAERYQNAANNALKRSEQYCEAANEAVNFLAWENQLKLVIIAKKRHRALIERNARRMDKSIEEMRKAESYDGKIAYWEQMAGKIDYPCRKVLSSSSLNWKKPKKNTKSLKINLNCEHMLFLSLMLKKQSMSLRKK